MEERHPRSLLRSISTVGGMTLLSRIFGLIRDMLMALFLGAGPVADAFAVSLRLPNMFRRIFAEGGYNQALIPLFSPKLKKEGPNSALNFANMALSWLVLSLLTLTVFALIFMDPLVSLLAPGFKQNPEKFALTVTMSRITFSYLFFISVTAHASAVLNALGRFALPALVPILLNLFLIITFAIVFPLMGVSGTLLAWVVFGAGIAQVLLLLNSLRRHQAPAKLTRPRLTPDMKKFFRLMGPSLITASAQQFSLLIATNLASSFAGAITLLYFAERLYQLPLALIGISTSVVLLPNLSRLIGDNKIKEAIHNLNRAFEGALMLALPASIALIILAEPLVILLFEHGRFGAVQRYETALATSAFALGLPAYIILRILSPLFFAHHDTRSPMLITLISIALNVVLAFVLISMIDFKGIALATSLSAWFNVLILLFVAQKKKYFRFDDRFFDRLWRISLSTLGMAIGIGFAWRFIQQKGLMTTSLSELFFVTVLIVLGLVLYGVLLSVTKAQKFSELKHFLR